MVQQCTNPEKEKINNELKKMVSHCNQLVEGCNVSPQTQKQLHVSNITLQYKHDLVAIINNEANDSLRQNNLTSTSLKSIDAKRTLKLYQKSRKKFKDIVPANLNIFKNKPDFSPVYCNEWTE